MRFTCSCQRRLLIKTGKPGMKIRCPGCKKVSVLTAQRHSSRVKRNRTQRQEPRALRSTLPAPPRAVTRRTAPRAEPRRTDLGEMIFTISDLLSPNKCRKLISASERFGFQVASPDIDSGQQLFEGVADMGTVTTEQPRWAASLWQAFRRLIPDFRGLKAVRLGETFTFYRFLTGQSLGWHKDRQLEGRFQDKSWLTLLVYLNDNFQGGGTNLLETVVRPRQGSALCFAHDLPHQSKVVIQGTQYIMRGDIFYSDPLGTMDATLRGY